MDTKTKEKDQDILRRGGQWLRVGVLTFTTLAPVINALLERMRQNSEKLNQQARVMQARAQDAQGTTMQRLEDLTVASRKQANEQAQQLREQAQQLQRQAEQLRKALREETKQRAKLAKQMRKAGINWSQDVLKRGEQLTGELVEQSAKLSHDLKERGEQITEDLKERAGSLSHDLAKRGGQITQDLSKRGSKVTKKVAKRGSEITHDLTGRGEELVQKRGRLLAIIGFSAAFASAAIATYVVMRRMIQQNNEQDQHIELPSNGVVNGAVPAAAPKQAQPTQTAQPAQSVQTTQSAPVGEIVILNADGTMVSITQPDTEGEGK